MDKSKQVNMKPIEAKIVNGVLTISAPVDTLAFAVQAGDRWPRNGDLEPEYKITDAAAFAEGVLTELLREDEIGDTLLYAMLDDAALQALESGADGVDYGE